MKERKKGAEEEGKKNVAFQIYFKANNNKRKKKKQ